MDTSITIFDDSANMVLGCDGCDVYLNLTDNSINNVIIFCDKHSIDSDTLEFDSFTYYDSDDSEQFPIAWLGRKDSRRLYAEYFKDIVE